MRKLLLIAVAGVALLLVQPTTAQAQQWVPGNPNFALNPVGRSYGSGVALPFTQPFTGLSNILSWNVFYNPVSDVYSGFISGHNSKTGFYSGSIVIRQTPYGSWYHFTPSQVSANRLKVQRPTR